MSYEWHKFDKDAKWYSAASFNHLKDCVNQKVGKLEKKLCERPAISTAVFGAALYAHFLTSKWSYVDGWGNMIKGVCNHSGSDFLTGLGYWSASIVPGLASTAYVTLAGYTFFKRTSEKIKKTLKKSKKRNIVERDLG